MFGFLYNGYPFYLKNKALHDYCIKSTNESIQRIIENHENHKKNKKHFVLDLKNVKCNNCNKLYKGELIEGLKIGEKSIFISIGFISAYSLYFFYKYL